VGFEFFMKGNVSKISTGGDHSPADFTTSAGYLRSYLRPNLGIAALADRNDDA